MDTVGSLNAMSNKKEIDSLDEEVTKLTKKNSSDDVTQYPSKSNEEDLAQLGTKKNENMPQFTKKLRNIATLDHMLEESLSILHRLNSATTNNNDQGVGFIDLAISSLKRECLNLKSLLLMPKQSAMPTSTAETSTAETSTAETSTAETSTAEKSNNDRSSDNQNQTPTFVDHIRACFRGECLKQPSNPANSPSFQFHDVLVNTIEYVTRSAFVGELLACVSGECVRQPSNPSSSSFQFNDLLAITMQYVKKQCTLASLQQALTILMDTDSAHEIISCMEGSCRNESYHREVHGTLSDLMEKLRWSLLHSQGEGSGTVSANDVQNRAEEDSKKANARLVRPRRAKLNNPVPCSHMLVSARPAATSQSPYIRSAAEWDRAIEEKIKTVEKQIKAFEKAVDKNREDLESTKQKLDEFTDEMAPQMTPPRCKSTPIE